MTDNGNLGGSPERSRSLDPNDIDIEMVPTTAADVESAGRSCMAIIVILGLIVLLLVLWLVLRSFGVAS